MDYSMAELAMLRAKVYPPNSCCVSKSYAHSPNSKISKGIRKEEILNLFREVNFFCKEPDNK